MDMPAFLGHRATSKIIVDDLRMVLTNSHPLMIQSACPDPVDDVSVILADPFWGPTAILIRATLQAQIKS